MKLNLLIRIAALACASSLCLYAQDWISIGVKAGLPLTSPFATRSFSSVFAEIPNPNGVTIDTADTTVSGGSRSFLIGPTLEVRLPLGFAIESDALYRQMNYSTQQTSHFGYPAPFQLVGPTYPSHLDSWEFPILAKYRFSLPLVKPYIEAGPSFRAASSSLAEHMSAHGVTAGLGVEATIWHLRITPEIRFTHWGADGTYSTPYHAVSYPNQVELLAGLSTTSFGSSHAQPGGNLLSRLSLGVKGGLPFTTAVINDQVVSGNFSSLGYAAVATASRNYLIGPMAEVRLPSNFSVEADALYGPISSIAFNSTALGAYLLGVAFRPETSHAWQFPVLAKYNFTTRNFSPYVAAGPTFRQLSSQVRPDLSSQGVTAGLGVEATAWRLHLAPEVRFVHWGKDSPSLGSFAASKRNQAQFLVGLSF